jgi:hypothetical protein
VIRSGSRFRALLVALAALALTAGAALAGRSALSMPTASSGGLERAADAAGKIVPVAGPAEDAEQTDEDADADEEAEEDAPADADAAVHPDNHGKLVSEAAQAPTPAGFDNHGQYVRTIASDNHGQEVAAERAAAKPVKTKPSH